MNSQNVQNSRSANDAHSAHSAHDAPDVKSGVSLEDAALTADELAHACSVQTAWVIDHVQAGLLVGISVTSVTSVTSVSTTPPPEMRFSSPELVRARRLLALERNFDANPELAALAVDLIEEVEHLRRRLQAASRGRWPLQSP